MTTYSPGRAALLLALLSLAACNSKKKDDEAGGPGGKGGKDGGPAPIKDYPVLVVRPDTVTLFQDYPATIQGQQNVEIRPKVDGFVEAIKWTRALM